MRTLTNTKPSIQFNDSIDGYDSVYLIQDANARAGRYFFSTDTNRFFSSRTGEAVYGGRFFVTSEKYGDAPRHYRVRFAHCDGSIQTLDPVYGNGRAANKAAARAAHLFRLRRPVGGPQ